MSTKTEVKERPILFNGEMVRATLDDRKLQTRRIIDPQPSGDGHILGTLTKGGPRQHAGRFGLTHDVVPYPVTLSEFIPCPYGRPGDRLYVRETWNLADPAGADALPADVYGPEAPFTGCQGERQIEWRAVYRATSPDSHPIYGRALWRPSTHMPRWASRILLEITDIRVERVTEISIEDIHAEGVACSDCWTGGTPYKDFPHEDHCGCKSKFYNLWQSINGNKPGCSWEDRPFVWVISFQRLKP